MDYLKIRPNSTVLVLNSSCEPLNFTNGRRAIILLLKGKAHILPESSSGDVIRLLNHVYIPFTKMTRLRPTRSMIYKRDQHKCQYCSSTKNLTLDHIVPKSRGGDDSWENLVVACSTCNTKKGDKFLEQTNMRLLSKPKAPMNKIHFEIDRSHNTEWKKFNF